MIQQHFSSAAYLFFFLLSLFFPIAESGNTHWFQQPLWLVLISIPTITVLYGIWSKTQRKRFGFWSLICTFIGAYPILILSQSGSGMEISGVWLYLLAHLFFTWNALSRISNSNFLEERVQQFIGVLIPFLFGVWILYLWELIVVGFGVPQVLLPAPSVISSIFFASTDTLWADFYQTFVKSVLPGFFLGCGSGFLVAVLVDRVPFLERGLLPYGNLISALPIVGVAPIMVMWFGFDWESKAAVVVIMTFFPMLVNTLAGLDAAGKIDRELIHTYHPTNTQSLVKVRLPYALPFLFNALKINSTLAIIGAIVAEFFGTPIVGMGFRISTEAGRMNIGLVWATIGISALSGSLFYGLLALIERISTFWHPSYRK